MDSRPRLSDLGGTLQRMPTHAEPYDAERLAAVLRVYTDDPMEDGDAVLLIDDSVCLEVAGLADHWDDDGVRAGTTRTVRERASRVVVAIARRGADLRPSDYRLWRELHEQLRDSDVQLLPVKALPAA